MPQAGRPLYSKGWKHYLAAGYNKQTKKWNPLAWKKGETYKKMFLVNSYSACVLHGSTKNSAKPPESLRVEGKVLKDWVPRLEKGAPITTDITLVELVSGAVAPGGAGAVAAADGCGCGCGCCCLWCWRGCC